ncbi:hypothetical protein N7488_009904 [Penicillium malachiteum]|nr:hypothetical protein N7488_009904 [Penicillium malachiteum]
MRKEKRKLQTKEAKAKTDEQKTEANDAKNMNNTTKTHSNNDQASAVQKNNCEKKAARRATKMAARNPYTLFSVKRRVLFSDIN